MSAAPPPPLPAAWLVTSREGLQSVFLDQARAEAWAARCGGVLQPLYLGGKAP